MTEVAASVLSGGDEEYDGPAVGDRTRAGVGLDDAVLVAVGGDLDRLDVDVLLVEVLLGLVHIGADELARYDERRRLLGRLALARDQEHGLAGRQGLTRSRHGRQDRVL